MASSLSSLLTLSLHSTRENYLTSKTMLFQAPDLSLHSRCFPYRFGQRSRRLDRPSASAPSKCAHKKNSKLLMANSREELISNRVKVTDEPCIVAMKRLMDQKQGCLSLAQGVVHWNPPEHATEEISLKIKDSSIHAYGPAEGLLQFREMLTHKVLTENHLENVDIMVTTGANQAFVNVILSLCDHSHEVVLFKPYYFNHKMALQMTGGAEFIVAGESDPLTFQPNIQWLESYLNNAKKDQVRMVVLVNPCNPTGVILTKEFLQKTSDICQLHNVWLVVDNTYEYFYFGENKHACISGPHVLNIFSFSKTFGMMGWRIGYIAYPSKNILGYDLGAQIIKVQDTIPICPASLNQHFAMECLKAPPSWIQEKISSLEGNRKMVLESLSPLGSLGDAIARTDGAIYLWARLPQHKINDEEVVEWLIREHGVALIPGSACGSKGYIRAAYANLKPDQCEVAAERLYKGLKDLVD